VFFRPFDNPVFFLAAPIFPERIELVVVASIASDDAFGEGQCLESGDDAVNRRRLAACKCELQS
jgi:hypothetical protein